MRARTGLALAASAAATMAGATALVSPAPGLAPAAPAAARDATLTVDLGNVVHTFRPDQALGAGVDGHGEGDNARIYTPANVRAMRATGLSPLTYRLRTELAAEAWHWNPSGSFSDPHRQAGYWTSTTGGPRFGASFGYRLPRRGDTHDQANDDGYSRLDDGDPHSFWKSNPYLDSYYTHESDASHPQWALVDFGHHVGVDALRISWGTPYATGFEVQYWVGPSAVIQNGHPLGHWADFPHARYTGRGGMQTLRLARSAMSVRFVRVVLMSSSHTAAPGSRDIRDRLGYAIRELHLGRLRGGRLRDLINHRRDASQTVTYASSTDPWHRASDRDPAVEQPSFQRIARSGLMAGQPLLVPVSVLYGTPADAVSEIRYLRAHSIPIRGVELGEEPDGQLASPEDYGALYIQFARALRRAFPGLPIGGPSLQTSIPDWYAWPDAHGNRSWTNRFIAYLRDHGAASELSFFSFEWYPFDNTCAAPGPQLAHVASTLAGVLSLQRQHGVPADMPTYITEYGYSAFAGQAEVDRSGALLNADTVGEFLSLGGAAAYLYGYEPDSLMREMKPCPRGWGNLIVLLADANRRLRQPVATYWGAQLETQQWVQPGNGVHALLASTARFADGGDPQLLGAYALQRPDHRVSLLLVNKDPLHTVSLRVGLMRAGSSIASGSGDLYQLSQANYVWRAAGARGVARPDSPPRHSVIAAGAVVTLPPFSLSVLRTAGG